jgi:hypothetical protein
VVEVARKGENVDSEMTYYPQNRNGVRKLFWSRREIKAEGLGLESLKCGLIT